MAGERNKTLQKQFAALNKNVAEQIKNMVAQAGTEAKLAAANGDFGKARQIIEQTTRLGGFMLERRSPTPGALPKFQNDMRNLSLSLAGEQTSTRQGIQKGRGTAAAKLTESAITGVPLDKPTQRAIDIADLRKRGFSETDAQDIAAKRVEFGNDAQGRPVLVNTTTGEMRLLTLEPSPASVAAGGSAVAQPVVPERSLFQRVEALGALPFFTEAGGKIFGQVSDRFVNERIVADREAFKLFREEIISALGKSGRPPVVEQARILEAAPSLGLLESPANARAQLRSLKRHLEAVRDDDVDFANNERNAAKLRIEAMDRARAIARVLLQIGTETPAGDHVPGSPPVTATNRETGEKLVLNPLTNQWEPAP